MCPLAQRSWHLELSGCRAFQAVLGFGEAAPGARWRSPRLGHEQGAPTSGTRALGWGWGWGWGARTRGLPGAVPGAPFLQRLLPHQSQLGSWPVSFC